MCNSLLGSLVAACRCIFFYLFGIYKAAVSQYNSVLLIYKFLVLVADFNILSRFAACKMTVNDFCNVFRLYSDISGHFAIVFVNINYRLQIACSHAACNICLNIKIFLCNLLLKLGRCFSGACCNTAAALSDNNFHTVHLLCPFSDFIKNFSYFIFGKVTVGFIAFCTFNHHYRCK